MFFCPKPRFDDVPPEVPGWIEVVTGPMFSEKSSEAIRRGARALRAQHTVAAFKHYRDSRYHHTNLCSHDGACLPGHAVETVAQIEAYMGDAQVLVFDELQFFDDDIVPLLFREREHGRRIIIAGLNMDYMGKPFGPMPAALAIANEIETRHAICKCGRAAYFSRRIVAVSGQVHVGQADAYEPCCGICWKR